ncbi:MAG: hypothetical protein ACOZBL_00630 [Patescibacteria group bacterium]
MSFRGVYTLLILSSVILSSFVILFFSFMFLESRVNTCPEESSIITAHSSIAFHQRIFCHLSNSAITRPA